jgi:hypothetical protein
MGRPAPLLAGAGVITSGHLENVEHCLFDLAMALSAHHVHVASLSSIVVYKVRGSIETLYQYYPNCAAGFRQQSLLDMPGIQRNTIQL